MFMEAQNPVVRHLLDVTFEPAKIQEQPNIAPEEASQ